MSTAKGRVSTSPGSSTITVSSSSESAAPATEFVDLGPPLVKSETRGTIQSGRWGEEDAEAVNVEEALAEFNELRQELTQRSTTAPRRTSVVARLQSRDEEDGGRANTHFVDLEEYLKRENRSKDEQGVAPKKIGVSFRNLTVKGGGSGSMVVQTFPQKLLDIFGYQLVQMLMMTFGPKPPIKEIISGFSGVVKPGEMLLVLGKPGSGASTLLRALTNQRRAFTDITGDIHYAGLPFELATGPYRGEIQFNDEEDNHIPTLTVDQTLRFALRTKTPHKLTPGTSRGEFVEQMLGLFANMFRMTHVLKTMVGNAYTRGVSGGERKRVSIMEALASRATINAWDNSTRGLDSSTAVDYIKSLRILTTLTSSTTITTLYQVGENIYKEFDKVCVIDSGHEIFYGKASEAREYFESLGFDAPPRITTGDFLTTVTDVNERRIKPGFEGRVPDTPKALEAAFRASKYWTEVQEELAAYDRELEQSQKRDAANFTRAVSENKSRISKKSSPFTVSFPMQVWYLIVREFQLKMQDQTALRSSLFNIVVLGLLLGSMFYNTPQSSVGAFNIGGVLFFNIILVGWLQMIEAIKMPLGRIITSKQATFAFYRPSALVLAQTIADLPWIFIQSTIATIIIYWLAGLRAEAGRFFVQLLFVFTTVVSITAFYRAIGAFSKDINVSIRIAYFGLNITSVFAGYMQPYNVMKSWVYKWIFWAHPISYSFEAVMANQFDGLELECAPEHLVPSIPGASLVNQVCTLYGAEPMSNIVSGTRYLEQFNYSYSHVWRNFGIIIAFTVFYIALAMLGVEYLTFGGAGGSIKVFTKKQTESQQKKDSLPTTENEIKRVPTKVVSKEVSEKSDQSPEGQGHGLTPTRSTATSYMKTKGSVYSWRNVNYSVGDLKLLDQISGFVQPGRLTALMGPSGAGKTTLLDNLALRKRVGVTTGEFLMNGKGLMPDFERSTAFVEQQDVHDWSASVREALRFSAELRQPASVPLAEKHAFVEDIIRLLELEALADAMIGMPGFGLSVEERKRVTIGVELAANPKELLFLDEPTSGLDSNGALSIVRFLRKLADETGIAILCTIHQPSTILFQDFDDLLLLQSGKQVYFGEIGDAGEKVISYFQRNGAFAPDHDANPAEYILDTIREVPAGHQSWADIWQSSKEASEMLEAIDTIITTRKDISEDRELRTLEFAMPVTAQIVALTKRIYLNYWRDASYGYSKMFSNISMALIAGVLFLNSGTTVRELQSRFFAVFLCLILAPMIMAGVQPKFLEFRMLYETRERNSKIYSAAAWITAMALAELPYAVLGTVFYFLPWYYMVGFPTASASAGYSFFLMLLFEIWAPLAAMWIVAMCSDLTIVGIVNPFIFVVTLGITGILVPFSTLPKFFSAWVYWVNPLTWFARGMMGNALHGMSVECAADELVTFRPPGGQTCGEYAGDWTAKAFGYIVDGARSDVCEYCAFKTGDEYLQTVNIEYSKRWRDLGVFMVYIVSNWALIYILYWGFREFRWGRLFARVRGGKKN